MLDCRAMDGDEREIFNYLKTWGHTVFCDAAAIPKRAGNKRYFVDPNWAKPVLMRMADRGLLEHDVMGRFRIEPVSRKDKHQRWVAPDIAKILQDSGVEMDDANQAGTDESYAEL